MVKHMDIQPDPDFQNARQEELFWGKLELKHIKSEIARWEFEIKRLEPRVANLKPNSKGKSINLLKNFNDWLEKEYQRKRSLDAIMQLRDTALEQYTIRLVTNYSFRQLEQWRIMVTMQERQIPFIILEHFVLEPGSYRPYEEQRSSIWFITKSDALYFKMATVGTEIEDR